VGREGYIAEVLQKTDRQEEESLERIFSKDSRTFFWLIVSITSWCRRKYVAISIIPGIYPKAG